MIESKTKVKANYYHLKVKLVEIIRNVTSNSSLSFKAKELKFCKETPQIDAKKVTL